MTRRRKANNETRKTIKQTLDKEILNLNQNKKINEDETGNIKNSRIENTDTEAFTQDEIEHGDVTELDDSSAVASAQQQTDNKENKIEEEAEKNELPQPASTDKQQENSNDQPETKIDNGSENPETADASNEANNLDHLSTLSQVSSKFNQNLILVAVILLAIIVTGFAYVIGGTMKRSGSQQVNATDSSQSTEPLQNDANYLENIPNQTVGATSGNNQSTFNNSMAQEPMGNPNPPTNNAKALRIRRNAPTQLYASSGGVILQTNNTGNDGGGNANGSPSNSTNVFAGKGDFSRYANAQSDGAAAVQGTWLAHPSQTIAAGEFIHAVLETAINSDLPGMVRAVVSRPVFAYVGTKPLIPRGSRLIGQYTSLSSNGAASTRVFVVWNRIITPDGISMIINSPGTNALGEAGMGANSIDHHFFKIFGTAALLSVMSATAANTGVSSYAQPNSADLYRQSIAAGFQQAAQASLNKNFSIKPTLHVYQGDAVNVFVARDVDLHNALVKGQEQGNSNAGVAGIGAGGYIK